MSAFFVDTFAARGHVRSIVSSGDLSAAALLPAVELGAGDATATVSRLNAGVAAFDGVLKAQLMLAALALASVIDEVVAADELGVGPT